MRTTVLAVAAALLATAGLSTHLSAQRSIEILGAPVVNKSFKLQLLSPASSRNNRFIVAVSPHTDQVTKFPPGTDRDAVASSRAKPEIWTQWAAFEAAANKLAEESGKLIDAAKSNDSKVFRAQIKAFGQACNGCHKGPTKEGGKFRFPK